MCFVTIIGEIYMASESFFWCYAVGVDDMYVTQAMCFASANGETHLAHIFFFADINSKVTLMGMTISRDFFFLQIRPLEEYVLKKTLLKISS